MLNFALIGCGRIAKRHSDLLGSGNIEDARLTAVCDTAKEKAQAIGEKFHVPYYSDMHEMMERQQEIDVLSVLTPSGMHARNVVDLAPYKRHIVVEKPMALNLADAVFSPSARTGDPYGGLSLDVAYSLDNRILGRHRYEHVYMIQYETPFHYFAFLLIR